MKGKPKVQFKRPDDRKIVVGDQRSIPDVTCYPIGSARNRLEGAGFSVSVGGGAVDSACPAGTAAGTDPPTRTIKNGVVVIQVSNGSGAGPTIPGFPPVTPPPRR